MSKAEEFVSALGECFDGVGGMSQRISNRATSENSAHTNRYSVRYRVGESTRSMSVRANDPSQAVQAVMAAHPDAEIVGVD